MQVMIVLLREDVSMKEYSLLSRRAWLSITSHLRGASRIQHSKRCMLFKTGLALKPVEDAWPNVYTAGAETTSPCTCLTHFMHHVRTLIAIICDLVVGGFERAVRPSLSSIHGDLQEFLG